MATQSLYRRYRPRRFAELRGQEHVVRALRTAVAEGREGQAYLFSGPRGTGKTTSARILAKVLNCERPVDGEPCCECESCLAVERGTSYDVHELDAASNNGVDAMRDLIEKASLGTPGRHKVYILDEVHMLSRAAEAALLKTLEEPPPHVVFVLATTDPQKMSDTIRSRTQHLEFHLLPADTLHDHVRWVAGDAGLTITDEAIEQVLAQGAGSARDTLSALELVANAGGDASTSVAFDDVVEAMIDGDSGAALTLVAGAVAQGRDPRTLTEQLIGYLRNGFLALMAPELVQLPSQRLDTVTDQARRLGPPGLVRGIEVLGASLTEMRTAPDPRVLLDVAVVQLTSDQVSNDVSAILTRLQRLERQVAEGAPAPTHAPAQAADGPTDRPAKPPERAALGGRARRAAAAGDDVPASAANDPVPEPPPAVPTDPAPSNAATEPASLEAGDWDAVRPELRGMARAVYAPATFVSAVGDLVTLALPNDTHRAKCEQHRATVEGALSARIGSSITIELIVGGERDEGSGPPGPPDAVDAAPRDIDRAPPAADVRSAESAPASAGVDSMQPAAGRAIAERARTDGPAPEVDEAAAVVEALPTDDDVDLDDLTDVPPESVKTPIDRLADAFPGSELVDDVT